MAERRNRNTGGFTLIEVLLALIILVGITTVTWRALSGIMRTRQLLDDQRVLDATANSLVLRLTRELQLADDSRTLLKGVMDENQELAGKKLYGVHQEIEADRAADSIYFMARSGAQYVEGAETTTGVIQISYRVAEDPDQPRSPDSTMYLIRDETPDVRPVEKARKRTVTFPITNRLMSLKFRYYQSQGDLWTDSWSSEEQSSLPSIIEFSFELKSPLGRVSRYTTAVPVRAAGATPAL